MVQETIEGMPSKHNPIAGTLVTSIVLITYSTVAEESAFSLFHRTVESRDSITMLLFIIPLLHTIPDLTGFTCLKRQVIHLKLNN